MQAHISKTDDGSDTIYLPEIDEHYHSTHGAVQESEHVFIRAALDAVQCTDASLKVFEMGFGTGLNALLSYRWAEQHQRKLEFYSVEKYPIPATLYQQLNYGNTLSEHESHILQQMHQLSWGSLHAIGPLFSLHKTETDLLDYRASEQFHAIFMDAFSPGKQAHLWSEAVFRMFFGMLREGGVLTTYSSKGDVKRALKAAGFRIEKLPGPAGKRDMLRARKAV